jgi:hypothetical protein
LADQPDLPWAGQLLAELGRLGLLNITGLRSMQGILKNLPDIIKVAASSNLGIIALMLIVLSGLAYAFFRKSNEIWRFAALTLLFAASMSFGVAVFNSLKETPAPTISVGLFRSIDAWNIEAEHARSAKTLSPRTTPPASLIDARNNFESAWKQAPLLERKTQDAEKVSKALLYLNRLYRLIENDSSTQPNANYWADEAIHHFEEIQNRKYLTEALLDKAAIYLDIAQLGHNDKIQFETMARNGDAVITKAYQTASEDQRASVLRLSSRFYYNLARPKSFRLSENWDNNYLLLAYQKAKAACDISPSDSKNANQLARTVIKASKNPPQNSDKEWIRLLRDSQQKLKAIWLKNQSNLVGLDQRLSPLNVLGVSTLETIAREWGDLAPADRRSAGLKYVAELDADAISPLREALALLQNSDLRKSYGFDLYYDLARMQALKTGIARISSTQRADSEFQELKGNLLSAKEYAKTSQLEAAIQDVSKEITFALLTQRERKVLLDLLSVSVK